MTAKKPSAIAAGESALKRRRGGAYLLRLYLTGASGQSARAIIMIKALCEEKPKGRYDMEVIDLHQQSDHVRDKQLVALPTLVKVLPLPMRRLVGGLFSRVRVLGMLKPAGKKTSRGRRPS